MFIELIIVMAVTVFPAIALLSAISIIVGQQFGLLTNIMVDIYDPGFAISALLCFVFFFSLYSFIKLKRKDKNAH